MTEDEAKAKWCFHFIASHTDPRQAQSEFGIEHGEPGTFVHHCIGSACMAWRWHMRQTNEDQMSSMMAVYPRPKAIYERTEDGHCGLAGRP